MNEKQTDRKLAELMASIRHYSTLRFAMLTVYFGITSGLLMKFSGLDFSKPHLEFLNLIPIAGGITTIAFFIFEHALNDNLSRLWKSIEKLVGKDDVLLNHRQSWKSYLVPAATYMIFAGMLLFWLYFSQYR